MHDFAACAEGRHELVEAQVWAGAKELAMALQRLGSRLSPSEAALMCADAE